MYIITCNAVCSTGSASAAAARTASRPSTVSGVTRLALSTHTHLATSRAVCSTGSASAAAASTASNPSTVSGVPSSPRTSSPASILARTASPLDSSTRRRARCGASPAACEGMGWGVAYTRYSFTCSRVCKNQSSLYEPRPFALSTPLQYDCATCAPYMTSPRPSLDMPYTMQYW